LLQPFADALKLIVKESILPVKGNNFIFIYSSVLAFTFSLNGFVVLTLCEGPYKDLNLGLLYILASSSLGTLTIILAG
jgi:NADH-quinone oxidoreductase subunit H